MRHPWTWLPIALVGILGLALVVGPDIGYGRVPGDLGDARFNSYVLEHGYRWLTGREASFWNAPFFYPFPLVITFSDNHIGNNFVYAILRLSGWDRVDAFRGWYAIGFVVNFAACAYALRRMSCGWLAAALGAFLFAYGLPISAQSGHAQLNYRFGVPLAVLALVEFERQPRLEALAALFVWTAWQFYCSIYIGYFLVLLLIAFAVATPVTRHGFGLATLLRWPRLVADAWRQGSVRARAGSIMVSGVAISAMIGLFLPYVRATRLYGLHNSWEEVASMVPRPTSYLLADHSLLWHSSWSAFDALPMRHEHLMFIGAAPLVAVVIAVLLRLLRRTTLGLLFAPTALAIGLVVASTLWVGGHTLYWLLAWLPGANAIRAVSRIGVVLLFPASVMFAASVDALSAARIAKTTRNGGLFMIAALLIIECSNISHYTSLKADWQQRLRAADAELPKERPASPILLLAPRLNQEIRLREIDAMLLAQDHGWPTLNGYSGHSPAGHMLTGDCNDRAVNIATALDLRGETDDQTFTNLAKRVMAVGYPDCDPAWTARRPHVTSFPGPLPYDLMAKTTVTISGMRISDAGLLVTVLINNRSDMAIPAMSSTMTWVRVSARYFIATGLAPEALRSPGWDHRQGIFADVPAGGSLKVDIPLPLPAVGGPYVVAVSMVQDGVAWFHDHGMSVAVSKQKLTMPSSGSPSVSD